MPQPLSDPGPLSQAGPASHTGTFSAREPSATTVPHPKTQQHGTAAGPCVYTSRYFFHFSGKKHLVDYLKPARDRATRLLGAVPRRLGTNLPPHAHPTSSPLCCERGDHTRKEHPQPHSGLHSPSLASFQLPASPQGTGRSQQAHGEEEVAMQAGASSEAAILSSGTGSPR